MANYPQYSYDYSSTVLYRTNTYGGTDPIVATSERFTNDIDLTQKVYAVCEIKFHAGGSTDDLKVNLYRRLDNNWDGDELAIFSTLVDSDGTEDFWSFTIGPDFGPGHYHFGLKSSGTADSFDIDFTTRFARYEVATS